MKIKIQGQKEKNIRFSGTAKALFVKLGLNQEIYIAARNTELLTAKDRVFDTDTIEILKVISGG